MSSQIWLRSSGRLHPVPVTITVHPSSEVRLRVSSHYVASDNPKRSQTTYPSSRCTALLHAASNASQLMTTPLRSGSMLPSLTDGILSKKGSWYLRYGVRKQIYCIYDIRRHIRRERNYRRRRLCSGEACPKARGASLKHHDARLCKQRLVANKLKHYPFDGTVRL